MSTYLQFHHGSFWFQIKVPKSLVHATAMSYVKICKLPTAPLLSHLQLRKLDVRGVFATADPREIYAALRPETLCSGHFRRWHPSQDDGGFLHQPPGVAVRVVVTRIGHHGCQLGSLLRP